MMCSHLGNVWHEGQRGSSAEGAAQSLLCQGFALPLEQVVSLLGGLELRLHQSQRLARGEDCFSGLGELADAARVERASSGG
jgi:hypothetical protein